MDRLKQINTFNRFSQVSRETIVSLKEFEKVLLESNNSMNLISRTTIDQVWHRHILDSFQVIDYIDKLDNEITDIGSGAGFPGLILAIAAKDKKIPLKVKLIEKSSKKTKFLNKVIQRLDLNVEVVCKNIFDGNRKMSSDIFVARAFKPLPIILKLIHNQVGKYKKFFVFLGKTGNEKLLQASKSWDIEYKKRKSITNDDSIILEINNLKKK